MTVMFESDEAFTESDEAFGEDSEAFDEAYDEALRRRITSRVPTARPSTYRPPITNTAGYATTGFVEAKVAEARNALSRMIEQNSGAIRRVDGKIAELSRESAKHRRVVEGQVKAVRRDIAQTRELAALMPLLSSQSSKALTSPVGGLAAGDKVVIDTGDKFTSLLPLLLFSSGAGSDSSGGSGGSGGGLFGGGGSDNSLLMLALVLGMSK
jgi:uncharacterized membrane protein YgcG